MTMDLASARILVTNDDGINAPGIALLERVARNLSNDVWVVAPDAERSGAGHSLTMSKPIRYHQISERHFEVVGTPTDSVLLAVNEIIQGKKPDLVLSGINRGANVAEDVTYSGTIAAAMEATLLEIPAIALSTSFSSIVEGSDAHHWAAAEHFASDLIRKLCKVRWPHGNLMNVNFPGIAAGQVKGIRVCPQGRRRIGDKLDKRTDPKGRTYFWIAGPGTEPFEEEPHADYRQLAEGYITITPLNLDLTNYKLMDNVRSALEES